MKRKFAEREIIGARWRNRKALRAATGTEKGVLLGIDVGYKMSLRAIFLERWVKTQVDALFAPSSAVEAK